MRTIALATLALFASATAADTGIMTMRCGLAIHGSRGLTGSLGDVQFQDAEVIFTAAYDTNDIQEWHPYQDELVAWTAPILYATVSVPDVGLAADILDTGTVTAWSTHDRQSYIPGGLAITFPVFGRADQADFTMYGLIDQDPFLDYDLTESRGPVLITFDYYDVGAWHYNLATSEGALIVEPQRFGSHGEAVVEVGGQ